MLVFHGDIHPQNLLADDSGKTTIIDFAYSVTNVPLYNLNAELKQLSDDKICYFSSNQLHLDSLWLV